MRLLFESAMAYIVAVLQFGDLGGEKVVVEVQSANDT